MPKEMRFLWGGGGGGGGGGLEGGAGEKRGIPENIRQQGACDVKA